MDATNFLPDDITECHRLLLAAWKQSQQLEQQAVDAGRQATQAEQRVTQSEQQVAELNRVLDETAVSHEELR